MKQQEAEIIIYGAEQICASCVNLPSAKETFEWIEAAVKRKFIDQSFKISYVDIYNPPTNDKEKKKFAQRVIDEDLFYPVVVIGEKIVGEGNPKLKVIYEELEKYGYK